MLLELADGRNLTGECLSAKVRPDCPCSDEEVLAKVVQLTEAPYPALAKQVAGLLTLTSAALG